MSFYYSRIYGTYTTMKSTFSSARTHDLYESLPEEDRHEFPFDIAEVDWKAWLQETHLPALTRKPGRKRRRKVSEAAAGEIAAIFDVDGTLVASNVVSHYAWLKLRDLPAILRPLWAATLIGRVPFYWALDKVSRAHFNRAFYKNYKGWKPARARVLGKESFSSYLLKRLYPEAVATLRAHKAQGHRVVLLSGALVAGEARARMLASFARRRGVDLSRSYAYADSISDLPMLEAVGNPVAVNPDARLRAAAKGRGWRIKTWRRNGAAGAPIKKI